MPVAVVTGSSSGIGRATAIQFAVCGYDVVLHARNNVAGLLETASEIRELAPQSRQLCLTGNIACPRSCVDLVQASFAWQQSIDAWINNAGADVLTTAAKESSFDDKLALLLSVDVQGTIRLSRLVAKTVLAARKQAGPETRSLPAIVNIGWDQADVGMEGDPGQLFCTTKSAVSAFTRAMAMTVGPTIRVNCVLPGWVKTAWGESEASEYWNQRARAESLLDRWGTPEDIANTIVWLCSPAAEFINGQLIAINGGRRHQSQ